MIKRLILILLPFLLFISCKPDQNETAAEHEYGGTLKIAYYKEPASLNPLNTSDSVSTYISTLLFNSLIKYDEERKPYGDLAESWTVSDDGLIWTFKLQDDVTFHDGTSLTSRDVLFTYRKHLESRLSQRTLTVVENITAPDDFTIQFTLAYPLASFEMQLTRSIIPEHIYSDAERADAVFRRPVGSGPFKFVSWTEGRIELAANKEYRLGRPYLDGIAFIRFMNRDAAWAALLTKDIDLAEELDELDYRVLAREEQDFQVYSYIANFYYALVFNFSDPVFSDYKMRRTFQACVDREDLIKNTIIGGHGITTTGPLHPDTDFYNKDIRLQPFDPEKADRLLEEQGWKNTDPDPFLEKDGKDFTFSILSEEGDILKDELLIRLKWQFLRRGIKTEAASITAGELFGKRLIPGNFQAALLRFNYGGDPDQSLSLFWHSENIGITNLSRYKNKDVDKLIEDARGEMDRTVRREQYRKVHRIIADEVPAVFLFYIKKNIAVSSRVGGIKIFPGSYHQTIPAWYIKN
ncbi:MAG: ABC transporter substrate-binding protein [Spirochaetia bacterium]